MAQLSEFERPYIHVLMYLPQLAAMVEYDGRQGILCCGTTRNRPGLVNRNRLLDIVLLLNKPGLLDRDRLLDKNRLLDSFRLVNRPGY